MTAVIWSGIEKLMVMWINLGFTEYSQKSLINSISCLAFLLPEILIPVLFLFYRAALSLSQMNKMNMKATDSRIKILEELEIVELDKEGNVKLAVWMKAHLTQKHLGHSSWIIKEKEFSGTEVPGPL